MEQYQKYIGKVLEGRYLVEKLIGDFESVSVKARGSCAV